MTDPDRPDPKTSAGDRAQRDLRARVVLQRPSGFSIDVDLAVGAGTTVALLGPNGAGKTTMIRTILDDISPTPGTASIAGLDSHSDVVEIRNHIGYMPGDLAMYPNLTGRDTITYFANLRSGVDWSYVDELADRLDADLSRKVGDLSSGNR
ncbi:MAG: ATP-binding cassette domain-containing protein, partial [Acidimicrobiia bacterium]|nr:ATP-binding cassette domain-containing protein [Acidimicrobiia bacterium]